MKSDHERRSRGKQKDGISMSIPEVKKHLPSDYNELLQYLVQTIEQGRTKAVLSANTQMIQLYWQIGSVILQKQKEQGWGAKVIDRLAYDLKQHFPGVNGFSPRNLKYMRSFAEQWPNPEIVQRTVAQIPWRSNLTLLDKLDNPEERLWYAAKTLENGWSKSILGLQIEGQLYQREGKATNNFPATLPAAETDLVTQTFKDPYLFDFLGTAALKREAELEKKLLLHIQKFLLELGEGFAFVGQQIPLEIGNSAFYPDLLFYHLKLRRYVVVELKVGKFEPGHAGQLNMYTNAVDDLLKHPDDQPSIGLLLVKEKNRMVVEYALSGLNNPISVANWEQSLTQSLPEAFKSSLPSIEEIEAELASEFAVGDE